jgi:hypothetical protein
MSIAVSLVTVWQVVCDDNDGRPSPSHEFFEREEEAFERSKPGTWSGKGRPPKAQDAVKFPDGSVRLLGDTVILDGALAEREKAAARAKLTPRERKLLGVDK